MMNNISSMKAPKPLIELRTEEPGTRKSISNGPSSKDKGKSSDFNDMFFLPGQSKDTLGIKFELHLQNIFSKLKSEHSLMKHKYYLFIKDVPLL
jgi:hypothetical protein